MTDKVKRTGQNFSLDQEHVLWLMNQAKQDGHKNISRVLQRVLDEAAIRRDGFDWREKLKRKGSKAA